MNEQQVIQNLINQGYHVECVNPGAQKFNEKYLVYSNVQFGKIIDRRLAILDENGNIKGFQG